MPANSQRIYNIRQEDLPYPPCQLRLSIACAYEAIDCSCANCLVLANPYCNRTHAENETRLSGVAWPRSPYLPGQRPDSFLWRGLATTGVDREKKHALPAADTNRIILRANHFAGRNWGAPVYQCRLAVHCLVSRGPSPTAVCVCDCSGLHSLGALGVPQGAQSLLVVGVAWAHARQHNLFFVQVCRSKQAKQQQRFHRRVRVALR